jgi:transcriptional regulator with AAA-type ATPase domain
MKNIEFLTFLTKEQVETLKLSAQNYLRFARIHITIVSYNNSEIVVKIWQTENNAEKYLTTKELIERGKEVFTGIAPAGIKIHFRPIPFKEDSLESINAEWVNNQLENHSLKARDLVKLLNIDKGTLSRTLSSDGMTKSSKAMFYYLFKYLEKKQ